MNKHGQSIIEYALIAILIIVGIVIMGPYALRSVNAHFKRWNDGVQDSFTEKIRQAPINIIPAISTSCSCHNDVSTTCGSSMAGSQCTANELIVNHSCNPVGCDGAPASSCQYAESCCTTYFPQSCGTIPIGQTPPANNCNYGKRLYATQCSTKATDCRPDPNCNPQCLGIIVYQGSTTFCPSAASSLTTDYGITYVASPAACTSAKCQAYCNRPFILNTAGTACALPPKTVVGIDFQSHNLSCRGGGSYSYDMAGDDGTSSYSLNYTTGQVTLTIDGSGNSYPIFILHYADGSSSAPIGPVDSNMLLPGDWSDISSAVLTISSIYDGGASVSAVNGSDSIGVSWNDRGHTGANCWDMSVKVTAKSVRSF